MKKWLILGLLFCAPAAWGQSVRFQSQVIGSRGVPLANQNVAVCTQPANTSTTPCSPLATLATSTITTSGGANPLTTDINGNFFFYAAPGTYTIQIYGPAIATPFVQPDVPVGASGVASFTTLTVSGTATFTGTLVPCTMGPGIYIVGPAACPSLQTSINAAIALGASGGEVWIISPITISSTITVGQNSPSHIPVRVRVMRGAIITVTITNSTDAFQLASGSRFSCGGMTDSIGTQPQIVLSGTSVVRDVFRAMNQDGSQETMGIDEGCMVDGGAASGAFLTSVYNYSELFEGAYLHDFGATNYAQSGGGACGIKIFTVAAATDGAAAIDFHNGWIIPTGNNKWLCIDGTANTGVFMNRLNFDHIQFRANGTMTSPPLTILSGANGQIKELRFSHTALAAATISGPLASLVTINGLYDSHFEDLQVTFQSGTGTTIFSVNNNANQLNFGNCWDKISAGASTWTNILVDSRAPSAGGAAQTIAWNGAGDMLTHYCQDDGNVTVSRWNEHGWTISPSLAGGVLVGDTNTQTITNKTIGSSQFSTGNPTALGIMGFDGVNHIKLGDGSVSQIVANAGTTQTWTATQTFTSAQPQISLGVAAGAAGQLALVGSTSGSATVTAPAVAGTLTNAVVSSNAFQAGAAGTAGGILGIGGSTSGIATFTAPAVAGTLTNPVVSSNALQLGTAGTAGGKLLLGGSTSGTATFTAPAVAGTVLNPVVSSNAIQTPGITVTNLLFNNTAPTIAGAGCGGSGATISANNGTAAFSIGTGTTPTSACTVTMPTATTGWVCDGNTVSAITTTNFMVKQTGAVSTTSVVLTLFTDAAATQSYAGSDTIRVHCSAY